MNSQTPSIDISHSAELARIAEKVAHTQRPHELKRDNKTVAVIMPVGAARKPRKKQEKTKADYAAFRAAAGSWKDVDTDTLLDNIYADRRRTNSRPLSPYDLFSRY